MNRQVDDGAPATETFGRTQTTTVPIRTDEGGLFRAEVYTAINVSDDPELAEELSEGRLHEVEGPDGETSYRLAVPVRYHDPENDLFALIVPAALRHRTLELRRELLADLADVDGSLPAYVSNFAVVVAPFELDALAAAQSGRGLQGTSEAVGDGGAASERPTLERAGTAGELAEREDQLEEVRDRIDREREQLREELESEREELASERRELERLRNELEEEREQLESEREELEQARQSLEAERLNLEQKSRNLEQSRAPDGGESRDSTQVVTDDQFIEVEPRQSDSAAPEVEGGRLAETGGESSSVPERALDLHAAPIQLDAVPGSFDDEQAGGSDGYVELAGGRVRCSGMLPASRLESYRERTPRIFVQYHEVDGVPVAALTIGSFEDDEVVDSFGWPLDVTDDRDQSILHRLSDDFSLDVALYDEDGGVAAAYEFHGPFEENVEWILERAKSELEEGAEVPAEFEEVVRTFQDEEYERIGAMRHNFERDAFDELDSPSRVKLAAGVVGYWSTEQQREYLFANRTYPVLLFRELQEDVVEAALEYGIYLPEPLRDRAIDMGLVTDEVDLVERELANFAEVGVQLRDNDLDPVEEWENWDELIELAKAVGVTPDPDVLELAESSLQRAKDYQETQNATSGEAEVDGSDRQSTVTEVPQAEEEADQLVVGKRSEATGVTYYLPDDAVLDTFDDLADMPREDIEKLLDDPNGRLEAAQMLVERFDSDVVPTVLDASEQMSAPELTALARFLETKADGLEPELVRAVESGGPSATFIAARALAEIRSTSALPKLLEAYRDPERQLNREAVGRTLAGYGEKLIPELTSSIEEKGVDDEIVNLIMFLADEEEGVLEELEDHRIDAVREAAERARDQKL